MENEQAPPADDATVSIDIDATPDRVWRAITTEDGLAHWMGQGSTIGTAVGDEIDLDDLVTGERKLGRIDELEPGERLGYRWWPESNPEQSSRVQITLVPCESGTRVTVTETRVTGTAVAVASAGVPRQAAWLWRTALIVLASSLVGAARL